MIKSGISMMLAGIFLCSFLSGCTGFSGFSGFSGFAWKNQVVNFETTDRAASTLTFFGNKYEPENVRVIEEIISGFMAENPDIRVSYESLKGSGYFDALRKRIASGKGDDVFMVNHDILLELEQGGHLADLSGLDVIPKYASAMRVQMAEQDGAVYWLPTTVSAFGLYSNLDLLKAHGQGAPRNLKEWEQACGYFTSQGITPIIANNDISLKTMAIGLGFYQAYQQNRQQETFDQLNSGKERLSDYLRPGFSLAASFLDRGYIDAQESLSTNKTSDDLREFAEGDAPFMLTGAWAATQLKEMSPGFSFEVGPLPLLEDGALLVINADTRLSVNAGSKNLDAALAFVDYFTRAENIRKFADQQSSFSPLAGGAPSTVKEIHPLIPDFEAGRIVFGTDGILDFPIWDLTAEVSKKLLSGEGLESALAWMDRQIEEELKS